MFVTQFNNIKFLINLKLVDFNFLNELIISIISFHYIFILILR